MAPPVSKKKKFSSTVDHQLISSTAIAEHEQEPMGSLVKSIGKRQNVRVPKKTNKRILRKIWICNDILMDTLPFFDHAQLGLKLALLSPRFDVLVDKHFNGGTKEFTICKPIEIHKNHGMPKPSVLVRCVTKSGLLSKQKSATKSAEFPLPDRPLPNNIRFKHLRIEYIDHFVIAFFRANQKIFAKRGTNLDLKVSAYKTRTTRRIWNVFVGAIWPIFETNIRFLLFRSAHLLPGLIGDGNGSQFLFKWLHIPRNDGQPKRLRFNVNLESRFKKLLNNFKETFLGATTCASYILSIFMSGYVHVVPFELVNERTREKLTLEKEGHGLNCWLLKRCPIGQMVQWEDENSKNCNNNVSIELSGVRKCIGPLYPQPATEDEEKNQSNGKGRQNVRK